MHVVRRFPDRMKWKIDHLRPNLMLTALLLKIPEQSPYRCQQIGRGSPMVVLRRETWNVGGYMEVSGAPMNLGQNSGSCDNGCGIIRHGVHQQYRNLNSVRRPLGAVTLFVGRLFQMGRRCHKRRLISTP